MRGLTRFRSRRSLWLGAIAVVVSTAAVFGQPVSSAFAWPNVDGIIEGIAYRAATGEFYLGDVHRRCVWRRDRAGHISRFSATDPGLYGVFGLAIDERRKQLWAATAMIPETERFVAADRGRAALVALDLRTGRKTAEYPAPSDAREHVFGDLCVGPDGAIFVTDSAAPVIWRLAPGGKALEVVVESREFRSLQGIAWRAGTPARGQNAGDIAAALIVSDYGRGLFAVDAAARAVRPIAAPAGLDLRGLDGLVLDGAEVLAVSNGRSPQSLLRLTLSADATAVVHAETIRPSSAGFDDLTLMSRGPTAVYVIAGSGWAQAEKAKGGPLPPHTVTVFAVGKTPGN